MKVTNVKIRRIFTKVNEGPLAVASVTLDNEIAIHSIFLISRNGKVFVSMPTEEVKKNGNIEVCDLVHPITPLSRNKIETAIITAYEQEYYRIIKNSQIKKAEDSK